MEGHGRTMQGDSERLIPLDDGSCVPEGVYRDLCAGRMSDNPSIAELELSIAIKKSQADDMLHMLKMDGVIGGQVEDDMQAKPTVDDSGDAVAPTPTFMPMMCEPCVGRPVTDRQDDDDMASQDSDDIDIDTNDIDIDSIDSYVPDDDSPFLYMPPSADWEPMASSRQDDVDVITGEDGFVPDIDIVMAHERPKRRRLFWHR